MVLTFLFDPEIFDDQVFDKNCFDIRDLFDSFIFDHNIFDSYPQQEQDFLFDSIIFDSVIFDTGITPPPPPAGDVIFDKVIFDSVIFDTGEVVVVVPPVVPEITQPGTGGGMPFRAIRYIRLETVNQELAIKLKLVSRISYQEQTHASLLDRVLEEYRLWISLSDICHAKQDIAASLTISITQERALLLKLSKQITRTLPFIPGLGESVYSNQQISGRLIQNILDTAILRLKLMQDAYENTEFSAQIREPVILVFPKPSGAATHIRFRTPPSDPTFRKFLRAENKHVLNTDNMIRSILLSYNYLADPRLDRFVQRFDDQMYKIMLRKTLTELYVLGKTDAITRVERAKAKANSAGAAAVVPGFNPYEAIYIQQMTEDTVKRLKYLATTAKPVLAQAIGQGMANKEGISKIRDRVMNIWGAQAKSSSAEMLARTTSNDVYNEAHMKNYQNLAVPAIRFSAVIDDRTSLVCLMLNGTIWQMGDPDIQVPPIHFNCRSRILPYFDGIPGARDFTNWTNGQQVDQQKVDKLFNQIDVFENKYWQDPQIPQVKVIQTPQIIIPTSGIEQLVIPAEDTATQAMQLEYNKLSEAQKSDKSFMTNWWALIKKKYGIN